MELLLDLSSKMEAMEEFMAQHNQPLITDNQGSIPEGCSDQALLDSAVGSNRSPVATGGLERSLTINLMEAQAHVPEMMRWRLTRHLRLLLVESLSDESEMGEGPARGKKRRKALRSGKVRTADSIVVKRINWPHELMYTSGGKPAVYEQVSMPLFMSGYLCVLDRVKSGEKQIMLKHLKELMADASTYALEAVQAYHVVLLQQLENGQVDWYDADLKLEFRMPWSGIQASPAIPDPTSGAATCQGHSHRACHSQAQHQSLCAVQPGEVSGYA